MFKYIKLLILLFTFGSSNAIKFYFGSFEYCKVLNNIVFDIEGICESMNMKDDRFESCKSYIKDTLINHHNHFKEKFESDFFKISYNKNLDETVLFLTKNQFLKPYCMNIDFAYSRESLKCFSDIPISFTIPESYHNSNRPDIIELIKNINFNDNKTVNAYLTSDKIIKDSSTEINCTIIPNYKENTIIMKENKTIYNNTTEIDELILDKQIKQILGNVIKKIISGVWLSTTANETIQELYNNGKTFVNKHKLENYTYFFVTNSKTLIIITLLIIISICITIITYKCCCGSLNQRYLRATNNVL